MADSTTLTVATGEFLRDQCLGQSRRRFRPSIFCVWENYAPDRSSIGGKRIAAQGNLPSQCKVYVAGFRCEIFVIEIDKIK